MKYLAAAIVVVALIAADLAGDLGYIASQSARDSWAMADSFGLFGFLLLMIYGGDR